jgi:hypothetical protein
MSDENRAVLPRDLATPLTALLANGIPDTPVLLGR